MQTTPALAQKPSFATRILQYFVDRKNKIAILAILSLLMYAAQRRGYFKLLLKYMMSKVEEKMVKKFEESQKEMNRQSQKSSEFTTVLNEFQEKYPQQSMDYLKRFLDAEFSMNAIKDGLRNKNLPTAEKNKNWQAFKTSVLKSTLLTMLGKSYLGTVWLLRDVVSQRANSKIEQIIKGSQDISQDARFVTDALEASKEFIESCIDALVHKTLSDSLTIIEQTATKLDFKLTDKVTIDTFISRLEEVKNILFHPVSTEDKIESEWIELPLKKGLAKRTLPKLKHKRVLKRNLTVRELGQMVYRNLFGSTPKITASMKDSLATHMLLSKFKNYKIDHSEGVVVGFLLQDTKRRSHEMLSTIIEQDEKAEDHSEFVDEKRIKAQRVYEGTASWDSKDYEKQHTLFVQLDKVLSEVSSDFLDNLTSVNARLLTECGFEFYFKKLSNRLTLFKKASPENEGEQLFMKLVTSLNKILEEEFVDKQGAKNDLVLYESRSKDLFSIAKKNDPSTANFAEIETNILVAEEAKLHALYLRASREFAARIFYEEEFDTFFGEELDKPTEEGKSPAKSEQDMLMSMMSRLGNAGGPPAALTD
jgi:hypothetical protein